MKVIVLHTSIFHIYDLARSVITMKLKRLLKTPIATNNIIFRLLGIMKIKTVNAAVSYQAKPWL